MRHAGRQVEHIARFQYPLLFGPEIREDLQRRPLVQCGIGLAADAPDPPALALQQEHVVGIEVRPHAPARGGITHHHVIQARVGHESEAAQQSVGSRQRMVESLHQQRPVASRQSSEFRPAERTMAQQPVATRAPDKARLDIVMSGEREQFLLMDHPREAWDGGADQQRFFLPVTGQELFWRKSAEQARFHWRRPGQCRGLGRKPGMPGAYSTGCVYYLMLT